MVGAVLRLSAARHVDRDALVFGDVRLTYAQLERRAGGLANALCSAGVAKGERIALLLENCHQFVEVFFAAATVGAVLVPVNFRLAPTEISHILKECTPAALLFGPKFGDTLAPLLPGLGSLRHLVEVGGEGPGVECPGTIDYESWIAGHPSDPPDIPVGIADEHLILYTSGTTGLPKGAVWTHTNTLLSAAAKIIDFELKPTDTTAVFGPLFHAGPLMDFTIPMLQRGGRVVLGASRAFDPRHVLEVIERERVTVLGMVSTMWKRILRSGALEGVDVSSLRLIVTGGEPIEATALGELEERFPRAAVVNQYGSTEGGPIAVFCPPERAATKRGSVGTPSRYVEVEIVDPNGLELPPGEVGELIIRSPVSSQGYWNNPAATAAAHRNGWYWSGDLAWKDADGFIWMAGRRKDLIISGGENIYPAEVERVISALPGVAEVGVAGVPDEEWGEAVAAWVVPHGGAQLSEADVVGACQAALAGYKKPRYVFIVQELPRTTVGKVSREVLRRQFGEHKLREPLVETN